MSIQISELNGVKIYNLAAGKTTPQFLEESAKKKVSLKYNKEYRNRIELIQDFEFPIASSQVQMTPDQQYVIATGIYAPTVKIFDTNQLSMKCLRGLDSEVIKFNILSDDYSKIAMASSDRSIELHAQYGRHYKVRVPHQPRDMVYNPFTCDLITGCSSNEIYRLSLDEGKFLKPFTSSSTSINTLQYNSYLNVMLSGGQKGMVEIWDYRLRQRATDIIANKGQNISKVASDSNSSLNFAVGSEEGMVRIYDYRFLNQPLLTQQHQYRKPINSLIFHNKSRNLISADSNIIKMYNKDSGKIFTNIEPKYTINNVELVKDSGLFLIANEQERIGCYFVPAIDNAPKWCPFIENITEELEEEQSSTIYEEFKFVQYDDLVKLNATNLIGTKMLKSYMHGYLMHIKLHQKLRSMSDPFEYERFRKENIKKKLDESRNNRITLKKKKTKVNQDFATDIKNKKGENGAALLKDDRFSALFTDEKFKIDKNDDQYKKHHSGYENNKNQEQSDEEELQQVKKKVKKTEDRNATMLQAIRNSETQSFGSQLQVRNEQDIQRKKKFRK